jgi:hypothetical protein
MDLPRVGEHVHSDGGVRGAVWSWVLPLVSAEKIRQIQSGLLIMCGSVRSAFTILAPLRSYLKKLSPRTLNVDGSRTDQQPSGASFSPVEHGTVKPALGRYR